MNLSLDRSELIHMLCYPAHGRRNLDWAERGGFRNADAALKSALGLQVPCGKFSYANIAPECILGVSGTLQALGDYELEVMGRYGIQLFASMPSVYGGESHFTFDHAGDAIVIESSQDNFYRSIADQVNKKTRSDRAVIVFLQEQHLSGFKESAYFKKVLNANVLSESLDTKTRDFMIRKAATHGQATFASEAFGRGTDFFSKDSKLDEAGGVHVLQTFFSAKKADEVQIQGRTARQGKKGTYGLILLNSDLKQSFDLDNHKLANVAHSDRYATLEEARKTAHATSCASIEEDLAKATQVDELTRKYFNRVLTPESLEAGWRESVASSFRELYNELKANAASATSGSYHVVFLVDTSGSMRSDDARPSNAEFLGKYSNRLGCALEACHRFVELRVAIGASDCVSLVTFDNNASVVLNSERLRGDMILDLVWNQQFTRGGTCFSAAFEAAVSLLGQQRSAQPVLVMFLTDGSDEHGSKSARARAIETLCKNERLSMMKAIGFGSGAKKDELRGIANMFHERGEYIGAVDEVQLVGTFETAAAELSYAGRKRW